MCRCSRLDLVDCMPAANAFWQDIIGFATSEKYILRQFSRFGQIVEVYVDKRCDKALVIFERVEEAEEANEKMRGVPFSRGGRLKVHIHIVYTGMSNLTRLSSD
eukprot:m.179383 g.179383  ORF g.179383 m.179383 type:complete len:104 (+) comp39218_c0_seq20:1050-1361(+)